MTAFNFVANTTETINLIYYGDPICSTCWINEPFVRKFLMEYEHCIVIEYRMGGLLESIEIFEKTRQCNFEPTELKNLWDEIGAKTGMTMEGDVWLEQSIQSSFPPSIAYYAAQNQGMEKALSFLRIIREMLFLQKKDISQDNHLYTAAKIAGMDTSKFMEDFHSEKFRKKLQKHIAEKTKWNVTVFPSLIFINENGDWIKLEEPETYNEWQNALLSIAKTPIEKTEINATPLELVNRYNYLASTEIAVILEKEIAEIDAILNRDYQNGKVIKEHHSNGLFWRKKESVYSISKETNTTPKAIIIGGGIAGLSTAINLKKVGFKPYVFERSSANRSNGLGFLMLKNGMEAFNLMGLKSKIEKSGNVLNHFKAINPDGTELFLKGLDDFTALNRDHCIKTLIEELEVDEIKYDKVFSRIEYNNAGQAIGVHFSDGSYESGDIIVGTDGINSKVRQVLYPDFELQEVGYKEIVCMTHMPELSEELTDTFLKVQDKGKSMGIIPFGNGDFIWFLQFDNKLNTMTKYDQVSIQEFVMDSVGNWPDSFKKITKQSDFSKAYLWNIRRMDLLPAFHKSGVLLLGDAAHPLISFTSQGANSAIEDSVLLAHFLSDLNCIDQVQKSFEHFNDYRYQTIEGYIQEGDKLLEHFLNNSATKDFKAPFANGSFK